MGRSPCCSKEGLNRGAWTAGEDKTLTDYIEVYGEGRWRYLPKNAGLKRCGKSCRLRWLNYLRPDIKRGNISPDEEDLIIRLHKLLGNRWSLIAGRLPGRTDNEIKNYWNTKLGKRVHQTLKYSNDKSEVSNKKRIPNTALESKVIMPNINEKQLVVRTKAVRCSKVFIIPAASLENEGILNIDNTTTTSTSVAGQALMVKDTSSTNVKQTETGPIHYDAFSSFTHDGEHNSYDFMWDFNVGETSITDLLNSDFSGFM